MPAELANPLQDLIGYQLRRASSAAMDELGRELAAVGLRPTEASLLLLIGSNPQRRSSEIGRELGIQRANMTPLVSALERRGFLARAPMDGRSHGLSLTPAGEAARRGALAIMKAHDARLTRSLAPAEVARLAEMLRGAWAHELEPDETAASA